MKKRRYSNFHRARKWHRKFRNACYAREMIKAAYCDAMADVYIYKSLRDGTDIDVIGDNKTVELVVNTTSKWTGRIRVKENDR